MSEAATYSGFATLAEAFASHKAWLKGEKDGKRADLSGADLSRADLSRADLSRADLCRANLSCANLKDANLRGADLSGANLSGAYLSGAYLIDADLSGADLCGANLSDADLRGAVLCGANLSDANLSRANLSDADLSRANLSDADLSRANLCGAEMPSGYKWEVYLTEVVPALCTAGGVALETVAEAWDCHSWSNCPMHVAFNAEHLDGVPALYRYEAGLFVQLFDAKLIPKPVIASAEVDGAT